jgi:outer membrane protein OmpA-like peptidoglycan-associated protein
MKKIIILFSALILTASFAIGQPLRGTPMSEKQKEVKEQDEITNYFYSAKWAKEVRKKLPKDTESLRSMAFSEFGMRDYTAASVAFDELLKGDAKDQKYQEDRFYFAQALKMAGKYSEAKEQFTSYSKYGANATNKALAAVELAGIEMAMAAKKNPAIVTKNIGTQINSANSELSAVYTGKDEIYYSALSGDELIELAEDGKPTNSKIKQTHNMLFKSTGSNGTWSEGETLPAAINKEGIHNAHVAFSADGNALYFSRCQLQGMTSTCDIYVSFKKDGNWMDAQKLEGGINGDYTSKQPTTGKINGRDAIFFASNMTGGNGGYDIYYAVQQDGAKFGTPVNLGEPVNTIGDEETPFYAADKLYFSSTGLPGFGGLDVFSSTQSGVAFSEPKNLGADVNTSTDDLYYSVDETGYKALVVSNRTSANSIKSPTCCYDIYTIDYPIPVDVNLEVLAFDDKGVELTGVTLALVESGDKDEQTNKRSNFFSWNGIKKEVTYKVIAKREGYKPAEIEVSTKGIGESVTLKEKITLEEIVIVDLNVLAFSTAGKSLNGVTVQLEEVGGAKDNKTNASANAFDWKDLKRNTTYKLLATKEGYKSASAEFNTNDIAKSKLIKETLSLEEIIFVTKERPLRLPGINFDLGKHAIREDAKPSLNKLVRLMKDIPAITKLEIGAHTDSRGGDAANQRLSERRANSAVQYLISQGISPSRLTFKGYGETVLKNTCKNGVTCSDEEHEINRRVEFSILEGPNTVPASYILEGITGSEVIKK